MPKGHGAVLAMNRRRATPAGTQAHQHGAVMPRVPKPRAFNKGAESKGNNRAWRRRSSVMQAREFLMISNSPASTDML